MAKKVLVFPSLSEIGEEIVRALNHNKEFELVLGQPKKRYKVYLFAIYLRQRLQEGAYKGFKLTFN